MTDTVKPNRRLLAKAATRAKVVTAAARLWSEPFSYEGVGMREIAAEAGVSTGAIFANFASKGDLWRAAMGYQPPVDCPEVRSLLMALSRTLPRAA